MCGDYKRALTFGLLAVTVVAMLLLAGAGVAGAGQPNPPLTTDEQAMLQAVEGEYDYAWQVMLNQIYGWKGALPAPWYNETVAGADGLRSSLVRARWLAEEMAKIGLKPGGTRAATMAQPWDGYLEDFHIDGWEEIESSAVILPGSSLAGMTITGKQNFKGAGTGAAGVSAPVVYVGDGRWDDFQRAGDIRGKIVLFHRQDPMFYGEPTLAEAKARGAVGAMMDYPITPDEDLKTDCIIPAVPVMYIRTTEMDALRGALAAGETVTVKLVVRNEVGDFPLAHNVVGTIEGSTFPNEYVYLACHYDHWMTSACDDGAGVASMFAIAKAIKESGYEPARTLVFIAFDSEELGGPPDTWYDWCMGSFAHIVGQLPYSSTSGKTWTDEDLLPAIHGERVGKIVAMWNMDVIGVRDAVVYVETTPIVTDFIKRCARATGLFADAATAVYWPPSSYDDWQFYMKGVPVMQIAWWGPSYDILYHTTGDVPSMIDPQHLVTNMKFNMLATWRASQSGVAPYTLSENVEVAEEGIANLDAMDPAALGKADISALTNGLSVYQDALATAYPKMSAKRLTKAQISRINAILMEQASVLDPHLFDWDCTMIPGWTGLFVFDTYANDLKWMNQALAALKAGDRAGCAKALESVTTMEWGEYVGDKAYATMLDHIAYTPHQLWGYGYIPRLTDVHQEYMSVMGRYGASGMTQKQLLDSLTAKRDAIYQSVTLASDEVGGAFAEAAAVLKTM
jgi:hypothetical protein